MDLTSASLCLALFGPPAVGVGAPIASWLVLWKRRRAVRTMGARLLPPMRLVVLLLLAWCALSVAAVILFQYLGFAFAWEWAHSRGVLPVHRPATLLFIDLGVLLLMCGAALALHRFVACRSATGVPTS